MARWASLYWFIPRPLLVVRSGLCLLGRCWGWPPGCWRACRWCSAFWESGGLLSVQSRQPASRATSSSVHACGRQEVRRDEAAQPRCGADGGQPFRSAPMPASVAAGSYRSRSSLSVAPRRRDVLRNENDENHSGLGRGLLSDSAGGWRYELLPSCWCWTNSDTSPSSLFKRCRLTRGETCE